MVNTSFIKAVMKGWVIVNYSVKSKNETFYVSEREEKNPSLFLKLQKNLENKNVKCGHSNGISTGLKCMHIIYTIDVFISTFSAMFDLIIHNL